MNPKRILISRTDRLGDVILSTPVIRYFRKKYPDAYIAFMVRPYAKDVVFNNPDLNEIIIYDKDGSEKCFFATCMFAWKLRKKKFDTAIALHPTNRTHIMFFIAGIPARIGYDRNLGNLLTVRVPHKKQEGLKHEAEYNFDLLKDAGFDTEGADIHPYIVTSGEEKKVVDAVLKDQGLGSKDIIAVHSGASCRSKRWDSENFAKVCDQLIEKHNSDIVLIGGAETEECSRAVARSMKNEAKDLTDVFLVGELAEFLSRCKLLISNDSGPVHVAVSVGTPVVAIFGRSDAGLSPKRWGPLGEKDIVLHKYVGCEKCLAHNCDKDFECLKAITVDEVFEAAEKILNLKI